MKKTTFLIDTISEKNQRAYIKFMDYLKGSEDMFNIKADEVEQIDFAKLRSALYSFFDISPVLVNVSPICVRIGKYENSFSCNWTFTIYVDKTVIEEGGYVDRESAEIIAFIKAFQFLDTKLFIDNTKHRFYDDSSDSSCLKYNWEHLNKVLGYKRSYKVVY